ncbi:hypothetical protein P3T36_000459 [Kitasatospora sp. MAP12-15]|uniref:hypothetical protein n=1 Tax=unclassified Kitasatospora TaxID=2633591 RepID=UPI00247D53C6|nr:hypothetical protein [Kitasatospora sp. MAP12-44]
MDARGPELDRTVPALPVKVSRYPQHHGGLGAIRTLGRCGVPVYAMVERNLRAVKTSCAAGSPGR